MQESVLQTVISTWRDERPQWPLWLPVCFGAGIGVYVSLPAEPTNWAAASVLVLSGSLWLAWDRDSVRLASIALFFSALGFAAIQGHATRVPTAESGPSKGPQLVTGIVDSVEHGPKTQRITMIRNIAAEAAADARLTKVRIRVPGTMVPSAGTGPGDLVRIRAVLRRPPPPAMPGGFDFQRHAHFRGISAIGYGVGPLQVINAGAAHTDNWRHQLGRFRDDVTRRILSDTPSQENAVAAALLTGHRGHLNEDTLRIMRDAGIAHLLAISGLHIGLVAGLCFSLVRLALCCLPRLSDRVDAKKIAAMAAMLAAFAYALLAGWTVPTQRAYVMVSIVLIAVVLDRRAVSLRGVAIAALLVLLSRPSSIIEPGFQMSFAAVTALVSAFALQRQKNLAEHAPRGIFRGAVRYVGGVMLASAIAGAATAPFAAYHFQHMAAFGLIANMLAVPMAAFWVMPAGMAALVFMPVGLEQPALWIMEQGIGFILEVAAWTSYLPGAALDIRAFPVSALVSISLGGLWLCLWQRTWRIIGIVPMVMGGYVAWSAPVPDIIVDGDARVFAIRDATGAYQVSSRRRGRFVTRVWMQRGGASEERPKHLEPLDGPSKEVVCDVAACILRRHGYSVSVVTLPSALEEDCRAADLVIALIPLRRACAAAHIDRFDLWRNGTHAVYIGPERINIQHVRGWRGERPWADYPDQRGRVTDNGLNSADTVLLGHPAP